MHFPSLFVVVVYVSGYLFLLFSAICLACGLYYLVELAEEYTSFTKKLIRVTILTQLVLHIMLYVYERFPFLQCFVGLASHFIYLNLLRSFPFIDPGNSPFIIACVMFIVDNLLWFRFFKSDSELFYNYRVSPAPATASFFLLVVWLVPCAFFCSLTVNDSVLPASATPSLHSAAPRPIHGEPSKRRRNAIMAALDSISTATKRALGFAEQQDILSSRPSYR